MGNVLGIINLINEKPFLKELTQHRCLASVPFAGRYRLIDFTLSNFVHAGITDVTIFTKAKFSSIMDHVRSGVEWDLNRHHGGLFILPPVKPEENIQGDLQHFHDHLNMFKQVPAETVVIAPGHHVGKIDYQDMVEKHRQSGADITVLCKDYDGTPVEKPIYHTCCLTDNGDIDDIDFFTKPCEGDPVCLETYVIDKKLLIDLMETCIENEEYDFLKDIVKANLNQLSIKAYSFTGYLPFIHSNQSYFRRNMDFLQPEMIRTYFHDDWDIYTKVKHESPAMYTNTSSVHGSLIANGCEIEGTVENSILFRGVKVGKGAVVKNCIIMQEGTIGENTHLDHVITDKKVHISNWKLIEPQPELTVFRKEKSL